MKLARYLSPAATGAAFVAAGAVVRAEVIIQPGPASAVIEKDGSQTTVRLTGPTRLEWQQYVVGSGETLNYVSQNGSHATLNIVRGSLPAKIDGSIAADGPYYLISPAGIQVGATGRIQAPTILLSGLATDNDLPLLSGGAAAFVRRGSGLVKIDGVVETSGGDLTVLGSSVNIGRTARMTAAGGAVRVVASTAGLVTGPGPDGRFQAATAGGAGLVVNEGWIRARQVELVSDGFIRNGGRLESFGTNNEVRLASSQTIHEIRPNNGSVISTSRLVVEGPFRQDGPVLNPNDGANPASSSGIRQTPRLSGGGFLTQIDPGQTQLSYSPLQSAKPSVSPIPPPLAQRGALAARRGSGEASAQADAKKKSAAKTAASASLRKGAFFGQSVRR